MQNGDKQQTNAYDQEQMLIQYAKQPSQALRNQIVTAHLHIARIIALRFCGKGVEMDDLFQVASMALIGAVEKFDPNYGVKFQSYATPKMVGAVKNHFRDRLHALNLPRKAAVMAKKIDLARQELCQTLMRSPTAFELAEHMGISDDELIESLAMRGAMYPASLDDELSTAGESTLGDFLGREDAQYDAFESRESVRKLIMKLDENERAVLQARFFGEKSQREVADALGISQMSVSRAERRALNKMRSMLTEGEDGQ